MVGEEQLPDIEISPSTRTRDVVVQPGQKPRRSRGPSKMEKSSDSKETSDHEEGDEKHPKLQRRNRTTFAVPDKPTATPSGASPSDLEDSDSHTTSPLPTSIRSPVPLVSDAGLRSGRLFQRGSDPSGRGPLSKVSSYFLEYRDLELKVPPIPPMFTAIEGLENLPEIPYHYVRSRMYY